MMVYSSTLQWYKMEAVHVLRRLCACVGGKMDQYKPWHVCVCVCLLALKCMQASDKKKLESTLFMLAFLSMGFSTLLC